jgi:outer membrane immunogenic protein
VKNMLIAAALAATALSAAPAFAQAVPTGPRIEGLVGVDRVNFDGEKENGIFYGVGAGYDFPTDGNIVGGIDAEATLSTTKEDFFGVDVKAGRDLYFGGRVSFARAPFEGFGSEILDGARLGAGVQFLVGGNAYVGGEYRHSIYEEDVKRHQLALVVGTRFGAPRVVEAPVAAPVAPEAPAAATQTCPDGSVILATDLCPAAPQAPAPAPSGERG